MKQANPEMLQLAARSFSGGAASLREKSKRVETIRASIMEGANAWQGQGANAFSARCQILNYELDQSAKVLEDASLALNQLALQMERVQQLRQQANQLESLSFEQSSDDPERRLALFVQAEAIRQEAEWEANAADAQAANAFANAMAEVPTILAVRDGQSDASRLTDLLNSLPPQLRSYYARHQDLLEEEAGLEPDEPSTKKRHLFLVGGIDPSANPDELAINNLGEMLVDNGEADGYTTVDEFTPNSVKMGVREVTEEKLYLDRHRSEDLAEMIEQYHAEHPDEEIDIIAHSGGGEISKNAQNELYFKGEGNVVNKIITFAGADWTDPENKKIYHITSPDDVVGVPGNLAQEMLGGTNNKITEFLGERTGKEEKLTLKENNQDFWTHVDPSVGDHVNYFEPGVNLDNSYDNTIHALDTVDNTPSLGLLDQKPDVFKATEWMYYSGDIATTVAKDLQQDAEQAAALGQKVEKGLEELAESDSYVVDDE